MKLGLGVIFYQSQPEIERLLQSIPNNSVDYIIWIDGIFQFSKEQNPTLPILSDFEVLETIIGNMEDKPNIENIFKYIPNTTENVKRNTYLETCKEENIDYLIIADSDEYFIYTDGITPERSWELFKKNFEMLARKNAFQHNIFSIRTLDTKTNTESSCPRCWFNPGDMRYLRNSHYFYGNIKLDKKQIEINEHNNLCFCQESRAVVKPLILAHDHSLRSSEQLKLREQYQRYGVKYEELVQNGYSHEKAHKIASQNPSKDFIPTA